MSESMKPKSESIISRIKSALHRTSWGGRSLWLLPIGVLILIVVELLIFFRMRFDASGWNSLFLIVPALYGTYALSVVGFLLASSGIFLDPNKKLAIIGIIFWLGLGLVCFYFFGL